MRMMLVLNQDEIREQIPYQMICFARYGSSWNTMRRKRAWKEQFSEQEREASDRLFRMAYRWTLTTGVPDEQTMSLNTLRLWQKLGDFCGMI